MKTILTYNKFINESFLNKGRGESIKLVLDYFNRKSGLNFYPYDEFWNIQKGNIFLRGQLFLSLDSDKSIRFNWIEGDLRNEIHSIDIWMNFEFDTNPNYTMDLGDNSVSNFCEDIFQFFNNPNLVAKTNGGKYPKVNPSKNEKSSTDSEKVTQLDEDLGIDVFKTIELYTTMVSRGNSNSLVISGDIGVGKTQTVKDTLDSIGFERGVNYYFITGISTIDELLKTLMDYREKLIILDDCDSILGDSNSIKILKSALNNFKIRDKFDFVGKIILISNLPESKIDKSLLSGNLHVDVHLDKIELIKHIRDIMNKLSPDVDIDEKEESLKYLHSICESYPNKFDLNIRSLIHSINLRANNEELLDVEGKQEPVWKLLIKKYLIK